MDFLRGVCTQQPGVECQAFPVGFHAGTKEGNQVFEKEVHTEGGQVDVQVSGIVLAIVREYFQVYPLPMVIDLYFGGVVVLFYDQLMQFPEIKGLVFIFATPANQSIGFL